MSLKKCKACGKEISKKAKACPSCGEPAKKKTSFVTWGILIIIVLLVYGGMNIEEEGARRPKPAVELSEEKKIEIREEAERRANESIKNDMIVKAKRTVRSMMKDPDSTKFKSVFFNETENGGPVVCGSYDSKNSFGAYSGYQRFISNGKTTFIEEKDKNIAEVWVEVCLEDKQIPAHNN